MALAVLSDLHGNLPALEAVLEEVERLGVERLLICGGVARGLFVRETLDLLLSLGGRALWLRGDAERDLVEFYDHGTARDSLSPGDLWGLEWEAGQIERRHRDFLAALPGCLTVDVEGLGPVLFCHGSPRSDGDILTPLTPEERLGHVLAGVEERVVICGQLVAFDRLVGGVHVVGTGSAGHLSRPLGRPPGAVWALLSPGVEFRRAGYDRGRAVARFRESGHPLSDSWLEALKFPLFPDGMSAFLEERARRREAEG
ncbi:metallophosphoesterase family protein [Deinococcus sp. YIM 134068]|uniref:metallophosphoesterase family protein n=1 Tax=Deinococcus lichenicola TaxID=3118910 RepID=UPI002F94FB40